MLDFQMMLNIAFMLVVTLNVIVLECRNTKIERRLGELERKINTQKRNNNRQMRNIRRDLSGKFNMMRPKENKVEEVEKRFGKNTLERFKPLNRKRSHSL